MLLSPDIHIIRRPQAPKSTKVQKAAKEHHQGHYNLRLFALGRLSLRKEAVTGRQLILLICDRILSESRAHIAADIFRLSPFGVNLIEETQTWTFGDSSERRSR